LAAHDLADEAVKRRYAVLVLAAAEQPSSMYVPRGEVGQGASTQVFMLNVDRPTWCWGQRPMFAPPCLNAGLLVDAEHVIARPQRCTFPATLVQIDDLAGPAGEVPVTWKDPTTMAPGA
jgi:hypothetical protein